MVKLTHKKVLKATNYYMEYLFDEETNIGTVHAHLDGGKTYIIKYDPEREVIISNFKNIECICPKYAANSFAECILKDIAKFYQYPYYFMFYDNDDNHFRFYHEKSDNSLHFHMISEELYNMGLNEAAVSIAKDNDLWVATKSLSEYLLNVVIE